MLQNIIGPLLIIIHQQDSSSPPDKYPSLLSIMWRNISSDPAARIFHPHLLLALQYKKHWLSYFNSSHPHSLFFKLHYKIKCPLQTRKFIAVVGATGNQGSSEAATFLNLPT
jgi:hypothetical protein